MCFTIYSIPNFYARFASDIGQANSKDAGDQREASALRDEVWHYKCRNQFLFLALERWLLHSVGGSFFLSVLTSSFDLWSRTVTVESNAPNLTWIFLQLDMLQEENENILEKVCLPFQESS